MELHQALRESTVRVVLPRNEQGGALAAAGYARACGRVGVCMATSGPGATNLVTGIADAYMDSIPIVAITGQVPQSFIGKNAFQETDIIGITRPIVKHSYLVLDVKDIPRVFAEAFHLAASGRPGPVVIDLPKDVQQKLWKPEYPDTVELPSYEVRTEPDDAEVEALAKAIADAERPCLYVGGGIMLSGAAEALREVAEGWNLAVVTTLMGVGALPVEHPLCLNWLGMHGTEGANRCANESDLLVCMGARFDDRVTGKVSTFAPNARIAHVDIDPSEINKNKRADLAVVCDVGAMLRKLAVNPVRRERPEWMKQVRHWRESCMFRYRETAGVQPQFVIAELSRQTGGEAIVVPGVGQHQMWSAQFYAYRRPRQLLTSGGLGTMGFGTPTAMGAKIACPDAVVINIDGDGSFQMNIQELGTIRTEGLDVKMVILNNQHLGMVAQWEDRFYGRRRGNTELANPLSGRPYPNFVAIAAGYEIPGREVWHRDEVAEAVKEMLDTPGPFVLDVHTGYEEHVLPMIPPGGSYLDMILE
jgi:acetolactate synthase-1/2/3 large subunit